MKEKYKDKFEELSPLRRDILKPMLVTTKKYWWALGISTALFVGGLICYWIQYQRGLTVTGLHSPVYWGIYIICFVFFIGISHAGTLISAILRVNQAEWRLSITRSAEFITVLVLGFGAIQPIIDLGRPDRMMNIIFDAHLKSPLLWDVVSIAVYLLGSTVYLYIPMLPDLAIIRDTGIKWQGLYRILALGYEHTEENKERLEKIIGVLAVVIIPIAISVHTIIGFIFALTLRPGWHSTIFGPYFVMGAIYSGIAALFIVMYLLREIFNFQDYLKEVHFDYLGRLFLAMSCLWLYFTIAEYLTAFYGQKVAEMRAFWDKLIGPYALLFWIMIISCFVIPFFLMLRRKTRTPLGCTVAGGFVVLGMWLERFNIVVPTSVNPEFELIGHSFYFPSLIEYGIMIGTFAGFILVYLLAAKIFPMISIWEMEEGLEHSVEEVSERVKGYLPERAKSKDIEK